MVKDPKLKIGGAGIDIFGGTNNDNAIKQFTNNTN